MQAAEAPPKDMSRVATSGASIGWANGALMLTASLAAIAKIAGVIVAPGIRGEAAQRTVENVEWASGTLAYVLAALLVALVCGGSFELARARRIGIGARGTVVGFAGLVVALASPAVVMRLHTVAALLLAVVTSVVALVAGLTAIRAAHTRALGAVLALLAGCGLLRPVAWEISAFAADRASLGMFRTAVALASVAVVAHALATLLAAAWLGTRSLWRGRVLANVVIALAFVVTYFAARDTDAAPTAFESFLHASVAQMGQSGGLALPFGLDKIAMFLVPASIVLAIVALVQRAQPPAILASFALALLSHGSFDVPLQALAVCAAAQWVLLAQADEQGVWAALVRERKEHAG
ncbi:MAG TPA: hypothetical protein VIF62_33760 [Labilithrix sp.]